VDQYSNAIRALHMRSCTLLSLAAFSRTTSSTPGSARTTAGTSRRVAMGAMYSSRFMLFIFSEVSVSSSPCGRKAWWLQSQWPYLAFTLIAGTLPD